MNGPTIADAVEVAGRIVRDHIALQPGEEVVIIADSYTDRDMLHALCGQIAACGAEYTLVMQRARIRQEDTHKLTRAVKAVYGECDVVIPATGSCGVSQYAASPILWPLMAEKRVRVFTLSERSLQELTSGGALADYSQVERVGQALLEVLQGASTVRITSALGTDLTVGIRNCEWDNLASFARRPGDEGGLPSGEVCADPRAESAEGVIVVDGPIGYVGMPESLIRVRAHRGKWVEVHGDSDAATKLRGLFTRVENATNVAEIAFGTNPMARRSGVVSEEKKRAGSAHLAFGRSNKGADWTYRVPCTIHGDMVLREVTVEVDGAEVVRDGQLLVGQRT